MTVNKLRYETYNPSIDRIITNIEKVIIGKKEVAELSIVALLTNGHVLLEDVPGVGKTMMVRAIAQSVGARFNRIQFTPDMLPSDLTGVSVFNQKEMTFDFRPGPLMGNIVLADEINRTSPKTQSALLEAMEERSVSVDGETHILPEPFFVMATQNPVEYEGTYPLPEAQLDRFLLKMKMGYPSVEEELNILNLNENARPIDKLQPVLDLDELLQMQVEVKDVFVNDAIKKYIVELVNHTRNNSDVSLGVSPRGSIALLKTAQAYAYILNRNFVVPDDVKYLAPFVLAHRLIIRPEARYEGISNVKVIKDILDRVVVPVFKDDKVR